MWEMHSTATEKTLLQTVTEDKSDGEKSGRGLTFDDGRAGSKGVTFILCLSVFGTSIGTSFLCGYNLAILNNPASMMKSHFAEMRLSRTGSAFTTYGLNWYWYACVAALPLTAPFGCYIGSLGAKCFGRKNSMMANNILLVLSGLLQSLSKAASSYEMFLLGRLIIGLHTGIATTVGPMYISEVSPVKYRGAFGAINISFISLGNLTSYILGFKELFGNEDYWPHLFTTLLGVGAAQLLILGFCPESPPFLLIEKKNMNAAQDALRRLRGRNYVFERDLQEMIQESDKTKELPEVTYVDFYVKRELRKPLLLAFGVNCCVQFSGLMAMVMYSEPIFETVLSNSGHYKPNVATKLVALITVTRLIVTGISILYIDKIGRRACQLLSLAALILCNTVLAFLLSDVSTEGQKCHGFPVSKASNHTAVVFIFLHNAAVSFGVSQIAWIISPELFRTNARYKAMFAITTVYWISNFLVAFSFDYIQTIICGWVFMIFTAFLVFFFIYFWFEFPIFDGKTADDVATMFEQLPTTKCASENLNFCEGSSGERKRLLK